MQMQMQQAGAYAVAPEQVAQYDPLTEEKLSHWVAAKRAKEYNTADRLREELRAIGIDAEKARPALTAGGQPTPIVRLPPPPQPPHYMAPHLLQPAPPAKRQRVVQMQQFDPAIEQQLDQWTDAKRAKDFGTADRIREQLRAIGVEPDQARPPLR
uniref:Uncharacterized protein n=1 Tax=Haptolina ericina TaxID=156174 RepID=A0A7S3BHC9_9EUKA